jgi:ABC-type dipeptide/oligopeptide/nickel transport system permease component
MLKYIRNKLFQYILVLFSASVILFVMVRLNPTDPVATIVGGKRTSPETVANIRTNFHLDKPPDVPRSYDILSAVCGTEQNRFLPRKTAKEHWR